MTRFIVRLISTLEMSGPEDLATGAFTRFTTVMTFPITF